MSSIDAVSAGVQPTDSSQMQSRFEQALQPVASLFGESTDSLISQLQSGQSLSGLATAQGVDQNKLISAIEQGMQSTAPSGAQAPSNLDEIAQNIANQTGFPPKIGGSGHGHHHHHKSGDVSDPTQGQDAFNEIADTLNMSTTDLGTALQNGTSLSSLAQNAGVSSSSVLDILQKGMQLDQFM